jgi:peptidoglycan/xylan/chitin deacetylase (PgdA/CDA1 family)
MRIIGRRTLQRTAAWASSLVRPGPVILGYHRIADCEWDPYNICVGSQNFSEQLDVLSEYGQPVSLKQIRRNLGGRTVSRRSIAITFDDGYADTFDVAAPLLSQKGIPATVFVVSGALGRNFWWDEILRIISNAAELPARFELEAGPKLFRWSGGTDPDSKRDALARRLGDYFRSIDSSAHVTVLARLRTIFGVEQDRSDKPDVVSRERLAGASRDGLLDIGSHTVSHVSLGKLSEARQEQELRDSKHDLEEIAGREISSFSYPNGVHSATTGRVAARLGFELACTSSAGVVSAGANPYFLPRLWVGDWDGDRFASWLKSWSR